MNLLEEDQTLKLMASFKPAEIEFLIYPKRDLKKLLKLTFFDLLLNQVLVLKKKYLQADKKAPVRELIIVETGKNFSSYQCNHDFEKLFTYRIDHDSYYFIIPFLKEVYQDIPTEGSYRRMMRNSFSSLSLYKRGFWISLFNRTVHNKKGYNTRNLIKTKLEEIDNTILELIEKEPDKAIQVIEQLKGNIFLLENFNAEFFKSLKSKFTTESNISCQDYFFVEYLFESSFDLLLEIFEEVNDYFDMNFFIQVDSEFDPSGFIDY